MALKVVKEKGNWLLVEAPSGKKGWIAKKWLVTDIQTESEILCNPTK
jgi:SH3-like domain-containing protein